MWKISDLFFSTLIAVPARSPRVFADVMQSIYFFSLLERVIRLEFAWHLGRLHAFFSLSDYSRSGYAVRKIPYFVCIYKYWNERWKNLKHLSQLLRTKAKLKKSRLRGRKKWNYLLGLKSICTIILARIFPFMKTFANYAGK